uniref:Uncharacterized protein n=1 Tax=viral metagenome TaxID=1070528 RepID=A0A6M3LRJ6_9ZZZZ
MLQALRDEVIICHEGKVINFEGEIYLSLKEKWLMGVYND